jgi:hypothetical protein
MCVRRFFAALGGKMTANDWQKWEAVASHSFCPQGLFLLSGDVKVIPFRGAEPAFRTFSGLSLSARRIFSDSVFPALVASFIFPDLPNQVQLDFLHLMPSAVNDGIFKFAKDLLEIVVTEETVVRKHDFLCDALQLLRGSKKRQPHQIASLFTVPHSSAS